MAKGNEEPSWIEINSASQFTPIIIPNFGQDLTRHGNPPCSLGAGQTISFATQSARSRQHSQTISTPRLESKSPLHLARLIDLNFLPRQEIPGRFFQIGINPSTHD